MEINQNIVEYYDELYPVTEAQKRFYATEMSLFQNPIKLLRVGCGTGTFEHSLAMDGADVTGLETYQELLESANRKRRTQIMSLRFFQMSSLEMGRFLGKNFYNIISILNGRILLTHDKTLMRKLFFDCRQLLTDDGHLILSLPNLLKYNSGAFAKLPDRKSIRSALYTQIMTNNDGQKVIQLDLETSSGKILSVLTDTPIYPLTTTEIASFAKEADFTQCEFFSDFEQHPFSNDADYVVAKIY
ncbi:MAG: methyltransferase domain-containing protein [Treponema sp.]|nr:methyltransferase domain-containing protein [Treponema sp.]